MPEIRNNISKMTIRGDLNLLYSMSKLIVSILDAAKDNQIACDTLRSVGECLFHQSAHLYGKICEYSESLYEYK